MRTTRAKVTRDQVCLPKKEGVGGPRNQKDNKMKQECFVETHLKSVQ